MEQYQKGTSAYLPLTLEAVVKLQRARDLQRPINDWVKKYLPDYVIPRVRVWAVTFPHEGASIKVNYSANLDPGRGDIEAVIYSDTFKNLPKKLRRQRSLRTRAEISTKYYANLKLKETDYFDHNCDGANERLTAIANALCLGRKLTLKDLFYDRNPGPLEIGMRSISGAKEIVVFLKDCRRETLLKADEKVWLFLKWLVEHEDELYTAVAYSCQADMARHLVEETPAEKANFQKDLLCSERRINEILRRLSPAPTEHRDYVSRIQ